MLQEFSRVSVKENTINTPNFSKMDEKSLHRKGIRGILVDLRDTWRDEIPQKIVHSYSRPRKVKARHGWFFNIILATDIAILMGKVTDPTLIEQAEEFTDYYTSQEFTSRLTLPKDIVRGNILLNELVNAIPAPARRRRSASTQVLEPVGVGASVRRGSL